MTIIIDFDDFAVTNRCKEPQAVQAGTDKENKEQCLFHHGDED